MTFQPPPPENATPWPGKGRGYPCLLCLSPIGLGAPCVRIEIKKAKLGLLTKGVDEDAHIGCARKFASDLQTVIAGFEEKKP